MYVYDVCVCMRMWVRFTCVVCMFFCVAQYQLSEEKRRAERAADDASKVCTLAIIY